MRCSTSFLDRRHHESREEPRQAVMSANAQLNAHAQTLPLKLKVVSRNRLYNAFGLLIQPRESIE